MEITIVLRDVYLQRCERNLLQYILDEDAKTKAAEKIKSDGLVFTEEVSGKYVKWREFNEI
jgi:hypothetical protein